MRKDTLYGKMSGSDRRRSSKRDAKDESRITFENMHDSGKSGLSYHDGETHDWLSPEAAAGNHSKMSAAGPLPGRLGPRRDDSIDEDRNRNLKEITTWEEDESYGIRMSPGLDYWRQQTHNRSPKNEWKRSRRSRSPSQNRSRSRSPIRGFGREVGVNDRSRSRSGASAQVCKNYASGWCRRGNHCQFLHGQTNEESSERQRTPKYPMPHNSREYPTGSGKSADYCTEFLKGSCRRGSSCRFAHHGSSDMSFDEATRGRNHDRRHKDASLERHNDHEPRRAAGIPCKFFAAGNCRNGKHCRFSHQDLAYPGPDKSRDGRVSVDHGSADVGKSYTKWDTSSDGRNLSEDKNEIIGATNQREADRSVDNEWGHCLEESEKLSNSLIDDKIAESKTNEILPWANADDNKLAFVERESEQWLGDMDMSPEWNYDVPITKPIDRQADNTNWNADKIEQAPAKPSSQTNELYVKLPDLKLAEVGSHGINLSDMISVHSFNQTGLSSNDLPRTGLSAVGQEQIAIPNSGGIRNPEIQMGVQEEKEINKPNIVESIVPQLNSGVAITQNNVSSEQLSTISASITQLLANGQQIEQPFGSLAQNMKGTSSFDNDAINMQSIGSMGMQRYDPTCDSIEVEKHEISMEKNIANEKLEITSQNKISSSAADAIESKEANDKSCQVIQGGKNSEDGKENNGVVAEENTKVENGPSEKNDDDGKKGKEAKGVKAFKFALVEFVKELLKPTWKEGQMSKDAYKNIVKKVVEKVTGTMQGANIPHTQEKIQQYLSTSKPKLTKLVQAYVVKFQKDK